MSHANPDHYVIEIERISVQKGMVYFLFPSEFANNLVLANDIASIMPLHVGGDATYARNGSPIEVVQMAVLMSLPGEVKSTEIDSTGRRLGCVLTNQDCPVESEYKVDGITDTIRKVVHQLGYIISGMKLSRMPAHVD